MAVELLSADEFANQVEEGGQLTLVDFYAEWCGPCKMVSPVLEDLAEEYHGKVSIVKLNTEEHPDIAQRYSVRGLPTLMMFEQGKPSDTVIGAQPISALRQFIERHL